MICFFFGARKLGKGSCPYMFIFV